MFQVGPCSENIYIFGNFNNRDPGSRYRMFSRGQDRKYYVEVPRVGFDDIEYKVTRGDWRSVECDAGGEVRIIIGRWKDR